MLSMKNIINICIRERALLMCTCTWLEIYTAIGVTSYPIYLQNHQLALLSASLFALLMGFHFIIDLVSKRESRCSF